VVLVLDVTNISQLVAYALPVAEELSAASTFWRGMWDMVPEQHKPLIRLPGSICSGENMRLSFRMLNGGYAIKGNIQPTAMCCATIKESCVPLGTSC
jgi:hypothetical protein